MREGGRGRQTTEDTHNSTIQRAEFSYVLFLRQDLRALGDLGLIDRSACLCLLSTAIKGVQNLYLPSFLSFSEWQSRGRASLMGRSRNVCMEIGWVCV